MEGNNRKGVDNVDYYYRITKIHIQKSSSNLDNKDTSLVPDSIFQNVWSLSGSDDEEEAILNIGDPEISDYDMSESLSSLV